MISLPSTASAGLDLIPWPRAAPRGVTSLLAAVPQAVHWWLEQLWGREMRQNISSLAQGNNANALALYELAPTLTAVDYGQDPHERRSTRAENIHRP
jgi:hypothetical protein